LRADVTARVLGTTGGTDLILTGIGAISVQELCDLNEGWLPGFMSEP